MKVETLGLWLVIIGAVNWGLVGISALTGGATNWNVVEIVFASTPGAANFVYLLIGVAGLWKLWHRLAKK